MEKYLNMSIKTVITEFPKVGILLNEYGIGCVTCGVGTCLLKDIIEIHNIPKATEAILMKKIQDILENNESSEETPGSEILSAAKELTYSQPIQRLVDEHTLIKEFLALIPDLCSRIQQDLEQNRELVLQSVDFIKSFADRFHHAKEEDILFSYTDENIDIIHVMLEDHKKGRYYVKSMLLGLETGDASFVTYSMKHYRELLLEHIKKEDEILYPWIEKRMTPAQMDELEIKFDHVDFEFTKDFYKKWASFVQDLKK